MTIYVPDVYAKQCQCRNRALGTCLGGSSSRSSTSCNAKLILPKNLGPRNAEEKPANDIEDFSFQKMYLVLNKIYILCIYV